MTAPATQSVRVGRIELAYEALGEPGGPPVVLVMGLGSQLHAWPDGLCAELIERGMYVIRFDNRDIGLSTHFHEVGAVDLSALTAESPPPYTLHDMAADTAGLIAGLGLGVAHLVGISMGGMIAQQTAIDHPDRVRSLVSIASTTGDPAVGQGTPEALQAIFTAPAAPTREAVIENSVWIAHAIGSTRIGIDDEMIRSRAGIAFDRCYDSFAALRQAAAIITAEDRTPALGALDIPALVIHGAEDPLIDVSGGRATAAAIPGAELMVIDRMGHDLPRALWGRFADGIERTVRRAE